MDAVFANAPVAAHGPSSVGDTLRQARLKHGWTLDSAAARTRIKRDYLEALEAMDPRGLPSRAYTIGYLRAYAGFLELNVSELVDQFKLEVECETGRAQPTAPKKKREFKLPKGVIGAVVILGSVLAATSWYGVHITRTGAFAEAPDPALLLATPRPVVESSRAPDPARIWADLPTAHAPEALVFTAISPVTLEVRDASGRVLFARELAAGASYRAPDEAGLEVTATDAGALRVRSGSQDIGVLGESGQILESLAMDGFVQNWRTAQAAASAGGAAGAAPGR
ncbi:MAG: helix-turn-helix domain-containing protein [Caulobacterales bacterium]|uniref:helix-turn-helix domain-containing protein n=1 Tax=Glycocaulis sp. TaxID=1969725 RepID=UPI003FA0845F